MKKAVRRLKVFIVTASLLLIGALFILYSVLFDLKWLEVVKRNLVPSAKNANARYSPIASFSMSSVENECLYVTEIKKQMEEKESVNSKKLNFLIKNYQRKVASYKKQINKLNINDRKKIENELENLKDMYQSVKVSFDLELKEYQLSRLNEMQIKIQTFLDNYNKTHNYDFILNADDNVVYFKNNRNDITKDIIDGLNKQYLSEKKNNK